MPAAIRNISSLQPSSYKKPELSDASEIFGFGAEGEMQLAAAEGFGEEPGVIGYSGEGLEL